jgi:MFS transporter, DHA3 family, tetracycline resistance protein
MFTKLNIVRPDAYRIYLIIAVMQSLGFSVAFTVNLVYQVTQVGLNPLQLVLVGTSLEVTAFLFEIPTGVVADVYSRRLSVILGYFLLGLGMIIEGSIPVFEALLFSSFVLGVGFTFISGATSAWIVDEIGQDRASEAFLRSSQVGQVVSFVGIFISIAIASISLQLAIVVAGISLIGLAVFLMLMMPEEGFQRVPAEERESWSDLFSTFRKGATLVRGRRILMTILLIAVIYGAFTEGFDRLWTAHILTNFTLPQVGDLDQIVWFGLISAVSMPATLVATELVRRRVDLTNSRTIAKVLSVVYAGLTVSVLVFALGGSFLLVLVGLWLAKMFRTVSYPLTEAWINQHTESNVRATVLSIQGQADAFGQIAGGPMVGFIGTLSSVRVAISVSALMLTPLMLVFNRTLKKES